MTRADDRWVVDRRLRYLTLFLLAAGFVMPVLPVGFVFDPDTRAAMGASGTGGLLRKMWLPLFAPAAAVIVWRLNLLVWMWPEINGGLVAITLWCVLSSLWAPDSGTALRQSLAMVGAVLVATAPVLACWNRLRLEQVWRLTVVGVAILSVAVALVLPDIGVHDEQQFELLGAWRGITYQKNALGQLAAVGLIFWVHALAAKRLRLRWTVTGIALCLFLLLKSRSSTSLVLSSLTCGLLWLRLRPAITLRERAGALALVGVLVFGLAGYVYVTVMGSVSYYALAEPFANLFGKDATLTGRTLIWEQVYAQIVRHPLLGTGFNSFWESPQAEDLRRALGWLVPNAHSGYLDLTNELGLIGLVLFALFIVQHFRAIGRLARIDPAQHALHLGLTIYLLFANVTESGWFRPISFVHVLILYSSLAVSRLLFEERLQAIRRISEMTAAGIPPFTAQPGERLVPS